MPGAIPAHRRAHRPAARTAPAGRPAGGRFGGSLPLIATALTAPVTVQGWLGEATVYAGLAHPIAVCLLTVLIGGLFLPETRTRSLSG